MAITRDKLDPTPAEAPGASPASAAAAAQQPGPLLPALGLGLLPGVLVILAYPPFNAWPLASVAFVPMLVGEHRVAPAGWVRPVLGSGVGPVLAGAGLVGMYQDRVAPVLQLGPIYSALMF